MASEHRPPQDLHSVQQVAAAGRGVPGVGRLLPGWRGESVPDRTRHPTPVRGHPAADGLHPHRPVPDAPAGGPAVAHALRRHGQHPHDQQEPTLGAGQRRTRGGHSRRLIEAKALTVFLSLRCFLR